MPAPNTPSKTSQVITRELHAWIAAERAQGHGHDTILQAMLYAGWEHQVAAEALTSTPPPPLPVPWPELASSHMRLDGGDRLVELTTVMREPDIIVFENLLSAGECEALIEAARPRLHRSLTVSVETGGEEVHKDRTSEGMFFTRGENALTQRIEARIARLLEWPIENGEGLQVLRYRPGTEYKPHYDYFDPAEPGTPAILERGGQRVATLIMYLQEPESGGATVFPDVRLQVVPKRGHAVFFNYSQPHRCSQSLHGGMPVLAGEKWIATKWLRESVFT
ncbi:MAG TPA: 2OG-Fe(II) oxygenase [Polaromonas sp.]|uniref:prolyl hydroxylase family protein n=1 Tax=Polaromonas sp. TaxID=1869339 RepID=UPI002D3AF902|nr:2OG-Fe(II) oxygenase [Polaromonas sp.]HYW56701.1 2OG-Fe(II) oxygenase [Polaromonas sp.]